MPTLFKGKQELKDELVERAVEHRKADRFRQQFGYFDREEVLPSGRAIASEGGASDAEWRGCAIGCLATPLARSRFRSLHGRTTPLRRLKRRYGIPETLAILAEAVFEEAWNGESASPESQRKSALWPRSFAEAIPVGVNLTDEDVLAFVKRSRAWQFDEYWDDGPDVATTARGAANALTRWLRSLDKKEND